MSDIIPGGEFALRLAQTNLTLRRIPLTRKSSPMLMLFFEGGDDCPVIRFGPFDWITLSKGSLLIGGREAKLANQENQEWTFGSIRFPALAIHQAAHVEFRNMEHKPFRTYDVPVGIFVAQGNLRVGRATGKILAKFEPQPSVWVVTETSEPAERVTITAAQTGGIPRG